jgi:hypothetical protein
MLHESLALGVCAEKQMLHVRPQLQKPRAFEGCPGSLPIHAPDHEGVEEDGPGDQLTSVTRAERGEDLVKGCHHVTCTVEDDPPLGGKTLEVLQRTILNDLYD